MPVVRRMRDMHLIAWSLVVLLSGCQSSGQGGLLQTLQTALWGQAPPLSSALNPQFSYLRVTAGKKVAFLALGYVDPHPQGPVEVWFSADREVLRLQNGRLVGAMGTLTEWRQVRLPVLPTWRTLANGDKPFRWKRSRDVMPGYRFNVSDALQVVTIAPPPDSRLAGINAASLTWFEEALLRAPTGEDADALPPARYAVEFIGGSERVVYAEQCLSIDLCLTWQRWKAGQ